MDKFRHENLKSDLRKLNLSEAKSRRPTRECESLSTRFQEPLKFYSNSYLKRHDVKEVRATNEPKTSTKS